MIADFKFFTKLAVMDLLKSCSIIKEIVALIFTYPLLEENVQYSDQLDD